MLFFTEKPQAVQQERIRQEEMKHHMKTGGSKLDAVWGWGVSN